MAGARYRFNSLPWGLPLCPNRIWTVFPGMSDVFERFRERLKDALQDNLVGIYFVGSIAFPGFVPDRVDLDFQAVVRHELGEEEIEADLECLRNGVNSF